MRLYHCYLNLIIAALIALSACSAPQATQALINISVTADGQTFQLAMPAGSTVQQVLDKAGLTLKTLDRTDPPSFTVLSDGAKVQVVRVTEEFQIEQVVLPFERQTLRNESLPVEKEILVQRGKTGCKRSPTGR